MEHSLLSPFNGNQLCASENPEIFFPEDESDNKVVQVAKQICRSCPNISDCLTYALSRTELSGIWGSTTTIERVNMRRRRRKALV